MQTRTAQTKKILRLRLHSANNNAPLFCAACKTKKMPMLRQIPLPTCAAMRTCTTCPSQRSRRASPTSTSIWQRKTAWRQRATTALPCWRSSSTTPGGYTSRKNLPPQPQPRLNTSSARQRNPSPTSPTTCCWPWPRITA